MGPSVGAKGASIHRSTVEVAESCLLTHCARVDRLPSIRFLALEALAGRTWPSTRESTLREAAEDLGPADETKDTGILLVTDGVETCGGDPEALVDELLRLGSRCASTRSASASTTKRRLEQVATKTGSTYTDAANTAKLHKAVTDAADATRLGEL